MTWALYYESKYKMRLCISAMTESKPAIKAINLVKFRDTCRNWGQSISLHPCVFEGLCPFAPNLKLLFCFLLKQLRSWSSLRGHLPPTHTHSSHLLLLFFHLRIRVKHTDWQQETALIYQCVFGQVLGVALGCYDYVHTSAPYSSCRKVKLKLKS